MTTQLVQERKLRTVSDLMGDIEEEISQIKDGKLTEGRARLVGTFRRMQLRGVEIYLQAARLEAKLRSGLAARLGELPPSDAALSAKATRRKARGNEAA